MDQLELIRITHEIDRHMAELSASVTDDDLRRDLAALHVRWREVGYRVSAHLCGIASNGDPVAPKRRGRRRRTDSVDVTTSEERDPGAGT